jgi:hypothetical protein
VKTKLSITPSETASDAQHEADGLNREPVGFIDTLELARRLNGVSPGTISNWWKAGKIPWIKTPGRLVLFDWESVKQSLLRTQRGAQ